MGLGFGRAGSRAARRSVEQEGGGRPEIHQLYEAKNLREKSQEAKNLRKNKRSNVCNLLQQLEARPCKDLEQSSQKKRTLYSTLENQDVSIKELI